MMNQAEARHTFNLYFEDLKAEGRRDGYTPDRAAEWKLFVATHIEAGDLTEEARGWSVPGPRIKSALVSVPTTCLETAYGTTTRLSFQIKVF